jgi:hypothetical protein
MPPNESGRTGPGVAVDETTLPGRLAHVKMAWLSVTE